MKKIFSIFLLIAIFSATFLNYGFAKVEWSVIQTLNLDRPPRDVAIAHDGSMLFVLTDEGSVLIYSSEGILTDTIKVGEDIDGIRLSRMNDVLFLSSHKNKTVKIILLDFILDINIDGAPYKGPEKAPVVITVFSDFQ